MRHILSTVFSIWATFFYNDKDHFCRNIVSRDLQKHKNVVIVFLFVCSLEDLSIYTQGLSTYEPHHKKT